MKKKRPTNDDVCFYIKKLDNHILKNLHSLFHRKELKECSLMNMWITDFLYDQGGSAVYQKDIEAEFAINRSTASKMLTLMEEKELIRRTVSETDARLKRIELLPAGLHLRELYKSIQKENEQKLTSALSAEELLTFKSLCRKMLRSAE